MKQQIEKARWLFFLATVLFVTWFVWGFNVALADDDRGNNTDIDIGGDTITGGDVSLNGGDLSVGGYSSSSRAIGLGRSSFDVDIADCRESVAFDTIIGGKQNVRLNPWCAAEVYEAKGLYRMAALMRCDIREIRKHFSTVDECVEVNTVESPTFIESAVVVFDEDEDEQYEMVQQQQAIIETQQKELAEVESRLQKLEKRRTAPRTQVNQVGLTDAQRKALAEVFEK